MLVREATHVDVATPSGPMRLHVHRPVGDARFPGLVVYSEIYQETAPILRIARLYAGHGFVVAVPEIFHEDEAPGAVLAYDAAGTARGNELKAKKRPAAHDADARATLDWLEREGCDRLTVLGFCIGGHLAFRAALDPRVRATVCFYATNIHDASLGGGDDSLARASEIRGDLAMFWGRSDPHVPHEGRARIHAALEAARVRFTWHEVEAQHAFMRDEGPRYDPALSLACHRIAIDVLRGAGGES
jgi:carboxymethylenebutenolidase